jgi:hypothetical protein
MFAMLVHELGIMHLVMGSKSYKITSKVLTQALSESAKLSIRVTDV